MVYPMWREFLNFYGVGLLLGFGRGAHGIGVLLKHSVSFHQYLTCVLHPKIALNPRSLNPKP